MMALEISGALLAPETLSQTIFQDLKAIRTAYPEVCSVVYESPPWVPGELIATLSDEQLEQISIQYGEVTSRLVSQFLKEYKVLKFTAPYNSVVLAVELKAKKLVEHVEPNNVFGDGDNIWYDPSTRIYKFKKGWGDCPAGCIMKHYWEFNVTSIEQVQLLREYGSPLEEKKKIENIRYYY